MAVPILAPSDTWYTQGGTTVQRSTITEINIKDSYSPTSEITASWDASAAKDGSITVYVEGTKLTIAGNGSGSIKLNEDSSWVFSDHNKSDYFLLLEIITGIELLDITDAITMERMFQYCDKLITVDVSNWDTSNVQNMRCMFQACHSLTTLDVSNWDTSNVTGEGIVAMFNQCYVLSELDVSRWNVSKISSMRLMFGYCRALNTLDVSNWDVSNVTDISKMFTHCYTLATLDLSKWDVSKVETVESMFYGAEGYDSLMKLREIDVSNWDVSSCKKMSNMFNGCKYLKTVAVDTWTDTSACEDMGYMFWGTSSLGQLDISKWNTSKVKSFHHFICHSGVRKIIGIEDIDLSSCETISSMLNDCRLEGVLDVSKWNTSKVEGFSRAFRSMNNLTGFKGLDKLDTSNGKSFRYMFDGIVQLKELDLSNFDTRNATTSWVDPVTKESGDANMGSFFGDVGRNPNLQKITLGENFSFDGSGDCIKPGEIAVFPTPNPEYIPETRGVWYNVDTLERFEPSEVPNRTAATYVCVPVDALVKNTTLYDFVDATRKLSGSNDKMTLSTAVSVLNESIDNNVLYETGKKAAYDEFWDTFQQKGSRTSYACGFGSGWNDVLFKPKYDICPTDGYMMFRSSSITDLKNLPVKLDFSKVTNAQYMFQWASVKYLGEVDIRALTTNPSSMFAYTASLVTIDKLILKDDGTQRLAGDMFTSATGLTNLTVEGVIGKSLSFQWSKKLSKESITSIINALSADKTGQTVTFSKTAKEAAFPEEEEEEWNALTGTKTNWKIALV